MSKQKILGIKQLNKRFGLFDNNHNYNLSEKSITTKPYSFQLWAVSYLVSEVIEKWNFEQIAFMMMITDLNYFESSFMVKRSGWSVRKIDAMITTMLANGMLRKEKPKTDKAIFKNLIYKTAYKYYPTHKYKAFIKRLEDSLKELHTQIDIYKDKGLEPPKRGVKGRGFEID